MNQAGFHPIVAEPRRWDVLESFMLTEGFKTMVEVGCKEGRTTGHILKTVPDSRVIAIDPWIVQTAAGADAETYADWNFASIEAEFWKNVGEHKDRCAMHRMTSALAAETFHHDARFGSEKMGGIQTADLVFIDARHDYDSVVEDIRLWWPKVRVGGIMSGHDFNHQWPGVERAVADCFNLAHVGVAADSVWFVIKKHEGQLRGA